MTVKRLYGVSIYRHRHCECFRRGGRKSEMEKKDERIANLERLLGKREFELDWLSKKAKELGL